MGEKASYLPLAPFLAPVMNVASLSIAANFVYLAPPPTEEKSIDPGCSFSFDLETGCQGGDKDLPILAVTSNGQAVLEFPMGAYFASSYYNHEKTNES